MSYSDVKQIGFRLVKPKINLFGIDRFDRDWQLYLSCTYDCVYDVSVLSVSMERKKVLVELKLVYTLMFSTGQFDANWTILV